MTKLWRFQNIKNFKEAILGSFWKTCWLPQPFFERFPMHFFFQKKHKKFSRSLFLRIILWKVRNSKTNSNNKNSSEYQLRSTHDYKCYGVTNVNKILFFLGLWRLRSMSMVACTTLTLCLPMWTWATWHLTEMTCQKQKTTSKKQTVCWRYGVWRWIQSYQSFYSA